MAIKVTLREKPITGNRKSLYLDFYPGISKVGGGSTRRNYLGLYITDKCTNPLDKQNNKEILMIAEQIRNFKVNELNKPEIYTGYELEQLKIKELGNKDFVEYFKKLTSKLKGSNFDNWTSTYNYLVVFTKGILRFSDLDEKFCNDFKYFLLNTKSIKSPKKSLVQNSASSYFNKFKSSLKLAYKEGYLRVDLNSRIDYIRTTDVIKQTLSQDELKLLLVSECPYPNTKKVVLFASFTGLPFQELVNLTWGNIEISQNLGTRVKMIRQKSKKTYLVNIPDNAFRLIGQRRSNSDKVFEDLNDKIRYTYFPAWLKDLGIEKEMTFHDLRHTYACLQLELGTDFYTVNGTMAHSSLGQTTTYAKISDTRKKEAADRFSLYFSN